MIQLHLSRPAYFHRAAGWLLGSGIQRPDGGLARYYRRDRGVWVPVSTEITGYGVSAFLYCHHVTGEDAFRQAALRAADFLVQRAWDAATGTLPFELARPGSPPPRAYFFDCGIVARGLLRAWRSARERSYLVCAERCAASMADDFAGSDQTNPILALPSKEPLPHGATWSRRPGCYQLKAALCWRELASHGCSTGAAHFRTALARTLATHTSFLCRDTAEVGVVDRLHAYCYFLEGLLSAPGLQEHSETVRRGIGLVEHLRERFRSRFERSDVYAQLLRVRLLADSLKLAPLDRTAAAAEADRIRRFQLSSDDPRVDGGFGFGTRDGAPAPHVNPVSTIFCLQALDWWDAFQAGRPTAGTWWLL